MIVVLRQRHFDNFQSRYKLHVDCDGLSSINARLRVAGEGTAGTVVCFSGSTGIKFWGRSQPANAALLKLQHAGFMTVQVAWARPGWLASKRNDGQVALAARPTEVIQWIKRNLWANSRGKFCVTGNSAGAAQCAYVMCHWNEHVDVAVFTGGPPMARIDLGCNPVQNDLSYTRQRSKDIIDLAYNEKRCSMPTFADLATLRSNSINIGGTYVFPSTAIRFLFGKRDRSSAVKHGLKFYELLANHNENIYGATVEDTGHNVQNSEKGANAIVRTILKATS